MSTGAGGLEARIARLERLNWLLLATLVAGIGVTLAGVSRTTGTVRASAFELVAEDGRVYGEFAVRDGGPVLTLQDEGEASRVSLFHRADASGLYVMDSDGVTRIGVAQFAHGGGGVALHGPESRGAAVLYLKGSGSLRFFSEDGAVTSEFPAANRAAPGE